MTHVEGEVNPVRDFDIISEELRLKDVNTLDKAVEAIERPVQRGDKKFKAEYVSILKIVHQWLDKRQVKVRRNWFLFYANQV